MDGQTSPGGLALGAQACSVQQAPLDLLEDENMQGIVNKVGFVRGVTMSGYLAISAALMTKFPSDVPGDSGISPASYWSFIHITWCICIIKLHYPSTIQMKYPLNETK